MKVIFTLILLFMSLIFSVQSHELISLVDAGDQEKRLNVSCECLDKFKHKQKNRLFYILDQIEHSADISIASLNTKLKDNVPLFFTVVKRNKQFFRAEPSSRKAKKIIALQGGIFLGRVTVL